MLFKIIAKNQFQHVTHHNYTISPRPQHMYDTLSYCPCCTFCILFLFWNLIIWISTLFAFTTATKRHTFYVPFSASARFGTQAPTPAVTKPDPLQYGYEATDVGITPVLLPVSCRPDDLPPPFKCPTSCMSTKTCTCRERDIKCVTFCGCSKGKECRNPNN